MSVCYPQSTDPNTWICPKCGDILELNEPDRHLLAKMIQAHAETHEASTWGIWECPKCGDLIRTPDTAENPAETHVRRRQQHDFARHLIGGVGTPVTTWEGKSGVVVDIMSYVAMVAVIEPGAVRGVQFWEIASQDLTPQDGMRAIGTRSQVAEYMRRMANLIDETPFGEAERLIAGK